MFNNPCFLTDEKALSAIKLYGVSVRKSQDSQSECKPEASWLMAFKFNFSQVNKGSAQHYMHTVIFCMLEVQLILMFEFSHTAPLFFVLFCFCFLRSSGLQCVPYDTVTSGHSQMLISKLFPLGSVRSHLSVRWRGIENVVSCSYLAVLQDHVLLSQKADLGYVNRNCIKKM